MKPSRPWSAEAEAILAELYQQARGSRKKVVELAAAALPDRSEHSVATKLARMHLSRHEEWGRTMTKMRAMVAGVHPRTVAFSAAPARCSLCGGKWRLETDPAAGRMLVCWSCCHIEYLYEEDTLGS